MKGVYRLVISILMGLMGMVGAWGQDQVQMDLSIMNASPNVSNLISSSIYNDVSISAGLPNYSVPIYTINSGGLSVPISLSYNYPGFMPQQNAGVVGIGWNLNAGGVIAKMSFEFNKATVNNIHWSNYGINPADTQYFHFCSYDFMGHSGHFIYHMDSVTKVKDSFFVCPGERLKIERGYTITDDNGNIYYFNDYETIKAPTMPDGITETDTFVNQAINYNENNITAFYLSKIVSVDKKDSIQFAYRSVGLNTNHADTSFSIKNSNTRWGKVLTMIESKDVSVQFILGADSIKPNGSFVRKDINGSYPWIKEIKVLDKKTGTRVKDYLLKYEYDQNVSAAYLCWLLLKKITEKDSKDSSTGTYSFGYRTIGYSAISNRIPMDYLGYYNGSSATGTNTFDIPQNLVGPAIPFAKDTGYWPVENERNALTSIVLPTGGNITYYYESNMYNDGFYRSTKTVNDKNYLFHTKTTNGSSLTIGTDTFELKKPYGNFAETIHIHYGRTNSLIHNSNPILTITKVGNLDTLFKSPLMPDYQSSGVHPLHYWDEGNVVLSIKSGEKYIIKMAAERDNAGGGDSVYLAFAYSDSMQPIKFFIAPGIKLIKSITTEPIANKTINKYYDYWTEDGYSTGTFIPPLLNIDTSAAYHNEEYSFKEIDASSTEYQKCKGIANLNFIMRGAQKYTFYYHKLSEHTITETDTLRTDYYFDLKPRLTFATNLELVKKVVFRKYGNEYIPEEIDSMGSHLYYGNGFANYWKAPTMSKKIQYDINGDSMKTVSNYTYNPTTQYIARSEVKNSDGSSLVTKYKHPEDYTDNILGLAFKNKFFISPTIEQQQWKYYSNGDSVMLGGIINIFDTILFKPIKQFSVETEKPLTNLSNETKDNNGYYTSLISDNHYIDKGDLLYDLNTGKLIRHNKSVGLYQYLIWGYDNTLAMGEVVSPFIDTAQAYTSFELGADGGWTISTLNRDTAWITGEQSFVLNGNTISRTGLNSSMPYRLSYWRKNNTSPLNITGTIGSARKGMTLYSWTYFEHSIKNINSVTITGAGNIDELRLYPEGAMMSTGTFKPLIGITSKCDANNRITYFEYDDAGRLKTVRNQYKEILKVNEYQYINK